MYAADCADILQKLRGMAETARSAEDDGTIPRKLREAATLTLGMQATVDQVWRVL